MSETLILPIDALRSHPRRDAIFGAPTAESCEAIRASIVANGIVVPLLVTAPDAEQNPSCVIDGTRRLQIARELGLAVVPAVVDVNLRSEVEQVERMFAVAQRADYTPRERAQQAAAFRAYLASLPRAERRKRYGNKGPEAIVAMVVSQHRNHVHQLDIVFTSASSTEDLKAAVDGKRIPPREARRIIAAAERRRRPGSKGAKELVNELLIEALAARDTDQSGKQDKRRRQPRQPAFNATPKPPSFLANVQREVAEWAIGQAPAEMRNGPLYAQAFNLLVRDLMVDLRAATGAFRARVRRLSMLGNGTDKTKAVLVVNEALAVLNLPPVKALNQVDLDDVRRTHRMLARAYHPDLCDADGARDEFERIQGAYENVVALCERR